jgi:hypothetical protein
MESGILRLDFLLASMMRSTRQLRTRLNTAGVNSRELAKTRVQAREAGLLRPFHVTPEAFIAGFGEPRHYGDNLLVYSLALWPEHLYHIGVREECWIVHHGFVLAQPSNHSHIDDYGSAKQLLRIDYHTRLDATAMLGPPTEVEAWYPYEEWTYVSRQGRLICGFDFGLLAEVRLGRK